MSEASSPPPRSNTTKEKEKGKPGPKGKMSQAIKDFFYPAILEYGKMKNEGLGEEAKRFKAKKMQEFKDSKLANPMDQVHKKHFDVDLKPSQLYAKVDSFFRNTYERGWHAGEFYMYRLEQDGETRADDGPGVPARANTAPERAKTAVDLFLEANKDQVFTLGNKLMDDELDNPQDRKQRNKNQLAFNKRAAKQLYDDLSADEKEVFIAQAAAAKEEMALLRKSPEGLERRRDKLVDDVAKLLKRVRGGQVGVAMISVEIAFRIDDTTVDYTGLSNARYNLRGELPMWRHTDEYLDAMDAFKAHAREYLQACHERETKGKKKDVHDEQDNEVRPEDDDDADDADAKRDGDSGSRSATPKPRGRRLRKKTSREILGEEFNLDDVRSDDPPTRDEDPQPPQEPSAESPRPEGGLRARPPQGDEERRSTEDDETIGDGPRREGESPARPSQGAEHQQRSAPEDDHEGDDDKAPSPGPDAPGFQVDSERADDAAGSTQTSRAASPTDARDVVPDREGVVDDVVDKGDSIAPSRKASAKPKPVKKAKTGSKGGGNKRKVAASTEMQSADDETVDAGATKKNAKKRKADGDAAPATAPPAKRARKTADPPTTTPVEPRRSGRARVPVVKEMPEDPREAAKRRRSSTGTGKTA